MLFKLLLILSITVWLLGLTFEGYISTQLAAIALVVLTAGVALGGVLGFVRILFPIALLVMFFIIYGEGNMENIGDMLIAMLTLLFHLLEIYLMFRLLSRKKD